MSDGSLYPYVLQPKLAPAIWGGEDLVKDFGKDGDPNIKIGESWECWDENRIANGALAGLTLAQARERLGSALLGNIDQHRIFPILTKIIEARDWLSVQVHPNDAYAQRVERQLHGDRRREEEADPRRHHGEHQRRRGGRRPDPRGARPVQEQDGRQSEQHGADKADLEGPEDVLRAPAQEEQQQQRRQGQEIIGAPPHDHEEQQRAAPVHRQQHGHEGQVAVGAGGQEEQLVDDHRHRRPVLVVR